MTDKKPLNIDIQSEIGELQAVLLHTPGAEVENMTPKMAQRALYSDILNLSIAQEEYAQLSGVLQKLAKVYTVSDLLVKVLDNDAATCWSRSSTTTPSARPSSARSA